ncbi:MAG: DinB family protein [Povalibacter sp.]
MSNLVPSGPRPEIMFMHGITLQALATFPDQLEAHFAAIPDEFKQWVPPSWDGIPSEHLTALEQVGHVRDVEIQGYQARIRRTLAEQHPWLPSLDTDALAKTYRTLDAAQALAAFREARVETMAVIRGLTESQLQRTADFEGYGPLTLRSLIHYLCSHDQQHLAGLQWLLGKIESNQVPAS